MIRTRAGLRTAGPLLAPLRPQAWMAAAARRDPPQVNARPRALTPPDTKAPSALVPAAQAPVSRTMWERVTGTGTGMYKGLELRLSREDSENLGSVVPGEEQSLRVRPLSITTSAASLVRANILSYLDFFNSSLYAPTLILLQCFLSLPDNTAFQQCFIDCCENYIAQRTLSQQIHVSVEPMKVQDRGISMRAIVSGRDFWHSPSGSLFPTQRFQNSGSGLR
ncbi:hypothetical protein J1605_017684 [Eschrichtius robustus]|uniref:Uncharacterized protein n=1 Tax=Eschrichtius robustus TaxID=9764 RepID=A0AB34I133_ESCRO|nr:hypothetical protein J1605_017684 [Eschrichtius robustus]